MTLIHELNNVKIDEYTSFCSFDIVNMYANIPTKEVINITKQLLTNTLTNNHNNIIQQILILLNTIIGHNYIQFNENFYIQHEGLAMGSPTSATFSEIFLQFIEHTQIYKILLKHQIINYFRYVDDILIIFNNRKTNIPNMLHEFNLIHPNVKFTLENETNNKLNSLISQFVNTQTKSHMKYIENPQQLIR